MAKNLAYPNADHIALTADKEYKSGAPVRIGSICGVAVTDGKLTKTKGTNKLFGVCLLGNTAANGDAEVHPAEIALD